MEIETTTAILLVFFIFLLLYWIYSLKKSQRGLEFGKRSLSVKYGKTTEQFFPFMKDYPFQPGGFRFLGTPIDGVQFEKDKVVLVEFKSGDSRLSARQQEIKSLVEKGKVEFREIRTK
ncbi:MAG: hypothetical protein ISS93_03640 [Candidatus Aenigmarchaeota archaeon]|nr:hypothetical protein [Candidatus Aenigmarchaeota archaeon]